MTADPFDKPAAAKRARPWLPRISVRTMMKFMVFVEWHQVSWNPPRHLDLRLAWLS
jgi:hypothetical protein